MADEYINAQDLTEDISLDGEEQFVMFDSTMGKRAKLKNIKTYMNADVAQPDGYYPELTAGNADASAVATALAGGSYTEESVPYKFRHTGGDVTAGGAEEDCIVGGTIAWNQIFNVNSLPTTTVDGVTFTNNGDGSITANGTATNSYATGYGTDFNAKNGHVYYWRFCPPDGERNTKYFGDTGATLGWDLGEGSLAKFTGTDGGYYIRLYVQSGYTINNAKFVPQIFDLTQMFGSAVADYIYSLEQSSAGKGVAFFRNMFPESYYEYNAGELKSVSGLSAHVTTGFNLWDGTWEVGDLDVGSEQETGGDVYSRTFYIPVMPNTTYYFSSNNKRTWIFGFDKQKKYTRMYAVGQWDKFAFTTDANTRYVRFTFQTQDFYSADACISLSGDRNGEYEPYKKHSYALDSSLTLRGVPKLVDNKVCFDGDEYRADGAVTRKYGIVDLGTLNWGLSKDATVKQFNSSDLVGQIKPPASQSNLPNIMVNGYVAVTQASSWVIPNTVAIASGGAIYVMSSAYSTASDLKAALSGVYLVYELATPTTETASAYVNPQACDEYGTEEYISTSIVPVGHKTKYYDNLTKRIDKLPSAIAPLERSATASANYSVGDYLILNNTLYKVTSAISAGGTITAGSNVTATTIMAEIKALR